ARALAVEKQPGDAVGIAVQPEMTIAAGDIAPGSEVKHAIAENVHVFRRHDPTTPINMAPPCPPPMHSVAMPRRVPSRFMALTRCSTMRLPESPTGWPKLYAP